MTEIDDDLRLELDRAAEEDRLEALLYYRDLSDELTGALEQKAGEGALVYNVIELAGCVALRASRSVLLELAELADVVRLRANPRFSVDRGH